MGDHFHLLLEIPERRMALARLGEGGILARLGCLGDEHSTKLLLGEVADCRRVGNAAGLARIA